MPTNTEITASLVAGQVPPDRNCPKSGQDVVELVQDFVSVQASNPSAPSSQSNSIADQALATANTAIAQVTALNAAIPQRRSSGQTLIPLPTGDSIVPISWSPDMPSDVYEVRVTLWAPNTAHPVAYYGWRPIKGTRTVNSVNISFDNIPLNSEFSWVVEGL